MSPYDPQEHHRRSVRLREYDYSRPGAYFVTICVRDRAWCVLGDVVNGQMHLTEYGRIAESCWQAIPHHFPTVELDAFVVMPNHVHGIIRIVGATHASPLPAAGSPPLENEQPHGPKPASLGTIIGSFKSAATKHVNQVRDNAGTPFWQRSFYGHVIRDQAELDAIRRYIVENLLKWDLDRDNPANIRAGQLVAAPQCREPDLEIIYEKR